MNTVRTLAFASWLRAIVGIGTGSLSSMVEWGLLSEQNMVTDERLENLAREHYSGHVVNQ